MLQGTADAPVRFVSTTRLLSTGLDSIWTYLDASGSNNPPINHVVTLATFFARLRHHKLMKPFSNLTRTRAVQVVFLDYILSQDDVHPNDNKVATLPRIPMATDTNQLRSMFGVVSYYCRFQSNSARCIRLTTVLLKKGARFDLILSTEQVARAILAELISPPILVLPD